MSKPPPDGPNDTVDVLAVDDTPANLIALEAVLARPGLNVVRASSGTEALALMPTREFAVVVLDAHMPVLDGFAVARRIRESDAGSATPIIFLTACQVSGEEEREAYASGAVDFVVKPFDPDVLRSKVTVFVELFRSRRAAAAAAARAARLERDGVEAAAREAEQRRLDRLKDHFLATLAHELRTPLTSLIVAADSLERAAVPNPTLQRLHRLIRDQLAHLRRLVEDSLEIARFTQGKIALRRSEIDLRDVVQRAVDLSQFALDSQGLTIELALPAEPVATHGDGVRLAQVVTNLLDNASKFSEWGGRVAVSLERVDGSGVIRVRDWGRGIPPPDLERIFEPFVQADVSDTWRGGLGVGLALVKKLVELHGGRVEASSQGSRQGTEFVVTLPLGPPPGAAVRPEEAEADPITPTRLPAPLRPVRVLVVDDSAQVRTAVELFLELAGHFVVGTVDSGRAALAEIERTDPDLVLLDIGLNDLDGYTVAAQIRASRPGRRPRLVAMTGKVGADERERALRAGFDAHLAKPVDGSALVRVVGGG